MFSYVALVAVIDEGFLPMLAFGISVIDEGTMSLRRHFFFVTLWKPFLICIDICNTRGSKLIGRSTSKEKANERVSNGGSQSTAQAGGIKRCFSKVLSLLSPLAQNKYVLAFKNRSAHGRPERNQLCCRCV